MKCFSFLLRPKVVSLSLLISLISESQAGEAFFAETAEEGSVLSDDAGSGSGDWLKEIKTWGTHRIPDDNPWFQGLNFTGRFQYQLVYTDVEDVDGRDLQTTTDEIRRWRYTAELDVLKYLRITGSINVSGDARRNGGDFDFGFQAHDVALLRLDAGAILEDAYGWDSLDKLHFTFGRYKHAIGYEVQQSSKTLFTPQRTSLSTLVFQSARPTAAVVDLTKDALDVRLALYSTSEGSRFVNGFNDGLAYYAGLHYHVTDDWSVRSEFFYNDADEGDDPLLEFEWLSSLSLDYDGGNWGFFVNGILGDNGDASNGVTDSNRQGIFGGVIVNPWYWIVEDKLQLVGRYQYAGSEESEGFRISSRFIRDAATSENQDVNGGFGAENHAIYLGLNYHIIDHRLKIQAGVEYEFLDTPEGDVEGFTYQLAFRTFF